MSPGGELPAQYLIYPVVVVAGVYLLCVYFRKIPCSVIFGLLFYLIHMALMLHIVPMARFMITADRYVYLASAGLFFIAAWYAGKRWPPKGKMDHCRRCFLLAVFGRLYAYTHVCMER